MKNSSLKKSILDANLSLEKAAIDPLQCNSNSSLKAVKTNMNQHTVAPPSHVWDKIEKILDEQEDRRKQANEIIAASFNNTKSYYGRKSICVAAFAGVSVVAGIMWIIR